MPTAGYFPRGEKHEPHRDSPDFTSIEEHIRNANLQRAAYMGQLIADGGVALARALKRLGGVIGRAYDVELDKRAIEADAFLRRSVPR